MTLRHVLHVGNILNNGYLHCKYLRRRGVMAESLNVDYTHCQGQPEWNEVRITQPVAHFDQDWSQIDVGEFQRPAWYHGLSCGDLPELADRMAGDGGNRPPAEPVDTPTESLRGRIGRAAIGHRAAPLRRAVSAGLSALGMHQTASRLREMINLARLAGEPDQGRALKEFATTVIADYDRLLPDAPTPLTVQDVLDHIGRARMHAPVFSHFPLIQGYSLDPIHPLLGTPGKPFICYEHGTMREFPYEDSARGRLYRLALKKAEKVFITNVDCIASAKRLELDNWVFIPHLIDDDHFHPGESPIRQELLERLDCDHLILCPARHHWRHSPDANPNSWFKANDVLIRGIAKFMANRPEIRASVIFFEWGMEVDLSKALIAELGIADRVHWEPIRSKLCMLDFYRAADVICDQFHPGLASFGAVVPEGLACGKPVISNLNHETHSWGFPVLPPVVHAPDDEAVAKSLETLFDDEETRAQVGIAGLAWFRQHHSSNLVIGRMIEVYHELSDRHGWGWRFD
ncbi:conserved hypothetical protein [Magnetospirillum sp. LM-5]|uniref:glycosyltransferase family 4 protein n=1 Tax=Magnetospirillum sp. LM-5 TaxID=2681466 RepID=UPI00137D871B|nr:glycosyltransferase family 4 protein [Magnetospirillum sp. LM-5]CAA7619090.1 conserved hypothetical protein [Magnetospirillum sp. LM-5]